MSYILDALRRAEADRERARGATPGVQSAVGPLPRPAAGGGEGAPLRWLIGGLAAGLALAAAGWWLWRAGPVPPQGAMAPVANAGGVAVPVPSTAPAPARVPDPAVAVAPARPANPAPVQAPEPAAVSRAPVVAPPRPAPAQRDLATATPAQSSPPAPARAGASAPAAPVVAASAAASAAPAAAPVPRDALPPELRQALPRLQISGSVYSAEPSSRFLVVNGEVAYEGQSVAPGVSLLSIGQRQSVFVFRGTRFTLSH